MSHLPTATGGPPRLEAIRRRLVADRDERLRADGGEDQADAEADDHLRDVPDGAGCTEIWEYLSERDASEARADD